MFRIGQGVGGVGGANASISHQLTVTREVGAAAGGFGRSSINNMGRTGGAIFNSGELGRGFGGGIDGGLGMGFGGDIGGGIGGSGRAFNAGLRTGLEASQAFNGATGQGRCRDGNGKCGGAQGAGQGGGLGKLFESLMPLIQQLMPMLKPLLGMIPGAGFLGGLFGR